MNAPAHGASAHGQRDAPRLHDVVIVGGGLVGASLAIALDRAGVDVALVDAAAAGALPPAFDERNLSFAEATVNALSALGVMQRLRAPTGAIARIHVSRAGDFGRVLLDARTHGRTRFGEVVVARDFGDALEAALADCARVARYRPARFLGVDAPRDGRRTVRIAGSDGEQALSARLLVGADGTGSAVRDALGIGAQTHDYAQALCVARLRTAQAPDGTAYERFGPDGPNALLPRGDRHFGLVHAVPAAQADAVAALDDDAFLARAQRAFGWRAGRFIACGARGAYPALRVVAARTHAPRAVLVGNAAQTLHPIGAQGFNLGLRDALLLAEMIQAEGVDAAGGDLLPRHAARRADDRERTLAFSDGLARMTADDRPLASALRGLGLFAADRSPALQAALVGGALGYRGDVPALCRVQAARA